MNRSEEVIIVHQQDYKDNDVILHVVGKDIGKESFYARGIKKSKSKNASSCGLFQKSRFNYVQSAKDMQSLKSAEKVSMYTHIYDDLMKQIIAQLFCEVMHKIEEVDYCVAYDILSNSLHNLNKSDQPLCVLALFFAKTNNLLGINPVVDECVRCKQERAITSISIVDGGFICLNCKEIQDRKATLDMLKAYRLFHKAGIEDFKILEELKKYKYEEVEPIIQHFTYYSGVQLKGLKFLESIIKM